MTRRIFYSSYWDKKNFKKKFCVGCRCSTNFKFSNRHNSPPNDARESKIPSFDSESRTLSSCILRFFSKKKSTFQLCFHFTIMSGGYIKIMLERFKMNSMIQYNWYFMIMIVFYMFYGMSGHEMDAVVDYVATCVLLKTRSFDIKFSINL